jgi:transposase-like protein
LKKAINENGKPSLVNIDQSGANQAGLKQDNRDYKKRIKIRQCKYLNNIIEQDHRRIKRLTRPMLGFKTFHVGEFYTAFLTGQERTKEPVEGSIRRLCYLTWGNSPCETGLSGPL